MKGMQKIKRGKNFSGVVQYALKPGAHHKSDPSVIGGNLLSDSALDLIAEFDTSKQLRPDVVKPVWHNSLRLPEGESLSNEQWVMFADDYMQHMGFSETHLRCYVLHDDEAGQHCSGLQSVTMNLCIVYSILCTLSAFDTSRYFMLSAGYYYYTNHSVERW